VLIDPIRLPAEAVNSTGSPVTPRPSATVVLMRGEQPWELLLMRRPRGADFAPGAYVFPGGTVHHEDSKAGDEIRMAAVRELFEEVGVLLARTTAGSAIAADCDRVRDLVAAGATFHGALASAGLAPAFDELALFARWVTPSAMSRRYDARFFLARSPAGQAIHAQEGEVTDWLWITPEQALVDDRVTLVYATRAVLESVATGESATDTISRARALTEVPIVEPRMVQTESGWTIEH
jgi:8-oxo-dGTP pyrophosphatase MutT (NUDIX family)